MKYFSSFVLVLLITCSIFAQPENCPTGMTHYWKLDESAGAPYIDSYGVTDALSTNEPVLTDGIVGNAQRFNGGLQEVYVPVDGTIDWGIDDNFTIEYWMKSNIGATGYRVAIGRDEDFPNLHWWSGVWEDGKAAFVLYDRNGTQGVIRGSTNLNDDEWYYIVCIRDADTDSIHLYVNGVLENSKRAFYSSGFESAVADLNIGYLDLQTGFHFQGTIDEIALYNKALSTEEIGQHYTDGLEGRGYCDGEVIVEPEYTLLADSYVTLYRQRNSVGDVHSNGNINYTHNWWRRGYHAGNISATGKIKVNRKNTIEGDAIAGGEINIHGTSTITGFVTPNTVVDPVIIEAPTFTAGGDNITVPFNNTTELDPGSYGNVKVRWFAKLKLSAGDYYFNSLKTDFYTKIITDVTDGPVNIYIVGKLRISSLSKVDIFPIGESGTEDLTITTLKTGPAVIGNFSKVLGSIKAPNGHVRVGIYSRFKGSILAKKITIKHGTQFLPHGHEAPLAKQPTQEEVNGEEGAGEIVDYKLDQNYPNPFNPTTTIGFTIPEPGNVTLTVYNLLGQNVATLVDEGLGSGYHSVVFNAKDLTSGIYIYRVVSANYSATKKMQLIK